MKAKALFAKVSASALALATLSANITPVFAESVDQAVTFYGTVTDAGQVVDKMTIDYGELDSTTIDADSITTETYKVNFKSTVDYGAAKGSSYADKDLTITSVSVDGNKVTVDFDDSEAATLTWLGEGRNYPGALELTVTQEEDFNSYTSGQSVVTIATDKFNYTNTVSSYKDLVDDEVSKFESVIVEDGINYEIHKGTGKSLVVWFHGNGEGDFPTKDTNNNVAQMLANRGTVAWATDEASEVFGDPTVIAFQAPSVWYTCQNDKLLEQAKAEIDQVVADMGIDETQIYVSGCSAGGFMTTRMLIAYPNYFKAAMINCPALDVADSRAGYEGATPTDEELATLKDSSTAIWLVQGATDSSVQTDACSKRIFNIITEGEEVTSNKFENGLASAYTTYETADNKFKLSLYDTTENAKLVFEEDYDKDGEKEAVEYSNHWSWIYTLRNNPTAADGTHIWNWAASYPDTNTGTQKVFVVGDDWGPAVNKTIITLYKDVDADSLDPANFTVTETKEATNWADGSVYDATADRKVTDVYLSDENGNKVDDKTGNIVTVEMYISPNDGSPFRYDLASGSNKWINNYQLTVTGKAVSDGRDVTVSVDNALDLADQANWITDNATKFDVTKTFTGTDGIVMPYGQYSPEDDGNQHALIVWLHGAGEGVSSFKNDNYVDLLGNEVTALVSDEFQNLFDGGAYVITPQAQTMWMDGGDGAYQNGNKGSMYADTLFELIEDVVKNNPNIDPNRVIIGGCSNGGYMTMEMVLKHPDYFYKAYPICEAFYDEYITDEMIDAVKEGGTELWFTYALTDGTVNPEKCSIPTIERMEDAGIPVHVSQWDDVHDTTGRFFVDEEGNLTSEDTGTPYEYNGHWSWIYFDNNSNTCDDCAANEWEWLASTEPVFTDVDTSVAHSADIEWLANTNVATGWEDGTFRPLNEVARCDMAAFIRRLAVNLGDEDAKTWKPSEADWEKFSDVDENTDHAEDILWLAHAGISKGWTDKGVTTFRPYETVARADMAAFITRLAQDLDLGDAKTWEPTKKELKTFKDIDKSVAHYEEVLWLAHAGISEGWTEEKVKTFRPLNNVARADMAAFLHRLANVTK